MRGYMQGALGALFAYGAAWWGAGERSATPVEAGVRVEPAIAAAATRPTEVAVTAPVPARAVASPPSARASAPAATVAVQRPVTMPPRARATERDPLADIEALPSDLAIEGMPATRDSLRQLAEYRQLAESPAALVERVERYDPTPEQVAELRRVAAQLFKARPAGSEGESPWAEDGTRDGRGSLVQRTEQSVTRERSPR